MNLRAMIVCNQYGRTFKCCRFDEKNWKFKWRTSFWILFEYGRICKVVVEKFIAIVTNVSPIYLRNQARCVIIVRVVCISCVTKFELRNESMSSNETFWNLPDWALVWYTFSFVLPLEFGTFVWTSRILNSCISTFSKSKSFSSKNIWDYSCRICVKMIRHFVFLFFLFYDCSKQTIFHWKGVVKGIRKLTIYNALLTLPLFVYI